MAVAVAVGGPGVCVGKGGSGVDKGWQPADISNRKKVKNIAGIERLDFLMDLVYYEFCFAEKGLANLSQN